MNGSAPVRSGWLPDPTGRFEERYAIRGSWTPRVRVGGAEAIDPVTSGADPADELPAWQVSALPDAGWRPDPTGRFQQRWWNGDGWTRKVRQGPAIATDIAAAPAPPRHGRRRSRGEDAPGWRADPSGRGQRYWNGHDWTAKWRPGPRPGPGAVAGATAGGWWARRAVVGLVAAAVLVASVVAVLVWLW